MQDTGLEVITNPGEYFLSQQAADKSAKRQKSYTQIGSCRTIVLEGLRPIVMEVQALTVPTYYAYPKRIAEGISLSRVQLICAVLSKYLGLKLYENDIYINLARGFKVTDRGVDLAVAAAIISSIKSKPIKNSSIIFGELNLSGQIADSIYHKRRIKEAKSLGYKQIITSGQKTPLSHIKELVRSL
jgi:DNA repair protein RadA/Sms